ncbi:MAG: hypothetical protein HOP23_10605 [Methylococcaceae bacterium]|nr:hypothetical protein [Methylococcaceae bacterium]
MPNSIQNQFDSILFEQGSFSAIPWLLKVGHLDYADYDSWRNACGGFLEDSFKNPLAEIIASLKLARDYAEKLNLDAVCQPYKSIEQKSLTICRSKTNEIILTTVYQPAENRVQMDLFFDSAPILAVQDLTRAIVERRGEDIPNLMERVESLAPETYTSFERLLAQQERLCHYPTTKSKIEYLLDTLTPMAFSVLGRFTGDYLTPIWQQLSQEISGRTFDAESPQDHLSFTAIKAFDWREVLVAIEGEEGWQRQPILLYRYAEACFKLNREAEGLASWFRLYMLFPESAERLVNGTDNFLLLSDWRNFNELDPELDAIFFPAWTVLKKPALAKLKVNVDEENIGQDAFTLICGLILCAGKDIDEKTLCLRSKLRNQNPSLFSHYMAGC